jgi:undecaprenyl-diphosphatase
MQKFKPLFNQAHFVSYFIFPLFFIWLIGIVFLFSKGYTNSFLGLNSINNSLLDIPMLVLTMFADAGFIATVLIFLLIKKQPYQLILFLIAIIVSGIIAQLFKNFVFNNWDRPSYLLKDQVHTVGNYILNHRSFPSGHSTTIAAIFTMLAYFRRQYKYEILIYAVLCPTIAYTRIYLGVHFLGDVVAGITLGFICSVLLIWLIKPFQLKSKPWVVISLKIASVIAAFIILFEFFKKYL